MSASSYLQAMPKVELNVLLPGAMPVNTLTLIAEQNEVPENLKQYETWVKLLRQPDYNRVFDIVRTASSWLQHGDDLVRVIYDFATHLAKQNVRYAEVMIAPSLLTGFTFTYDELAALLNDGRDRAKRAWGIDLAWIFTLMRDEPRKADELARWVSTAGARKAHVVALGLLGKEDAQPIGQFENAFKLAAKRDVPCVVGVGDVMGLDGIRESLDLLAPQRIIDARGIENEDAADLRARLRDENVSVAVSLRRIQKQGWVREIAEYPLDMLQGDLSLALCALMPALYQATLTDEYQTASEMVSLDAVETLALNAVRASFLDDDAKAALSAEFTQAYAALRVEHIETSQELE